MIRFAVLMTALCSPLIVRGQTLDFREVDEAVEGYLRSSFASGVGLIITTPQETVYEQVYGTATQGEVATLLSASKMPSTTAILTLVSEGRIGLDDRVGDYIPDWPEDKQAITIRQCLSCTAGFRMMGSSSHGRTLEESVREIAQQRLLFQPGEAFSYSGDGFQVAGRVAEIVSGQSWNDLFADRIAVPLNLKTFDYGPAEGLSLAASGRADMQDYAALLRLHLNDGCIGSKVVLSSDVCREMRVDHVGDKRMLARIYPFGFKYGMSWWIAQPADRRGRPTMYADQGASGATPWIDVNGRYGAFLYVKGLSQNWMSAARLWSDVAAALDAQFADSNQNEQ